VIACRLLAANAGAAGLEHEARSPLTAIWRKASDLLNVAHEGQSLHRAGNGIGILRNYSSILQNNGVSR